MLNDDFKSELRDLFGACTRSIEAAERAIEVARTSGHDELLEHLERIRDVTSEHVQALKDELDGGAILNDGDLPKDEGGDLDARSDDEERAHDEDLIDEASKESFPASDAPGYTH